MHESEGLVRLIDHGLFALTCGYDETTDVKCVLAAAAVQTCLGFDTKIGQNAPLRSRDIAKGCLDDIVLIKETFQQLGLVHPSVKSESRPKVNLPCTACEESRRSLRISQEESAKLRKSLEYLQKENERLLAALNDAYFGADSSRKSVRRSARRSGSSGT